MSLSELVADLKGLVSQPPPQSPPLQSSSPSSSSPPNVSVAHMFKGGAASARTGNGDVSGAQSSSSPSYAIWFVVIGAVVVLGVVVFAWSRNKGEKEVAQATNTAAQPRLSGADPAGRTTHNAGAVTGHTRQRVHFSDQVQERRYEPHAAPEDVRQGYQGGQEQGEGEGERGRDETPATHHQQVIPIDGSDVWG